MGKTSKPSVPDYATVTAKNPYATAISGSGGVSYFLNPFLTQQNQMIEQTVPELYQRLINPSLDDTVSIARRNAFQKALNLQTQNAFENNLINPLSQRRMLRSSLLDDMTNSLQTAQTEQIADFNNNLLANSLNDTQSLIDFYMTQYKNNSSFGQDIVKNALNSSDLVNSHNSKVSGYSNNSNQLADLARIIAQMFTYFY